MTRPRIGLNLSYEIADACPATAYFDNGKAVLASTYIDAVCEAGGIPVLLPCVIDDGVLKDFIEHVDGFVFTGGPDYPAETYGETPHEQSKPMTTRRVQVDLKMAKLALTRRLPVLGICAGAQLLNIVLGGKLVQHVPNIGDHRGVYHGVDLVEGSFLRELFKTEHMIVNSGHHQAVDPKAVGNGLKITAYAEDGTVEAVESTSDAFILGLQWHPEAIRDFVHRKTLFRAFVDACC